MPRGEARNVVKSRQTRVGNVRSPAWKKCRCSLLATLPHLGWLGGTGALSDDAAMRQIAAMPALRMLMCQDTQATDSGFAALSTMPSLRGLTLSCMKLGDDALALLPEFPALRELVPTQVPDEGIRIVRKFWHTNS